MDNEYIIKKSNFTLNIWNKSEFDQMVSRSTNTYFSKVIKAPVKKQIKPLAPTIIKNKNNKNNNKDILKMNIF